MPSIVALPMYAVPAPALATFWAGLRGHLIRMGLAGVPDALSEPSELYSHWLAPDLLLGQTCGYPLTTSLSGRVRYVGTPRYTAPGCDGPFYRSVLVVRADDPARHLADMAGRRVAFNSRDSQSGVNALRSLVAPLATDGRFFAATIETGGHRHSVQAVQGGQADIAAIDAVTFALLSRDHPAAVAGLRQLGFTAATPSLPFITALDMRDEDVARLRAALAAACTDTTLAASRSMLLLDGFDVLPLSAYDAMTTMRDDAAALGYPELA